MQSMAAVGEVDRTFEVVVIVIVVVGDAQSSLNTPKIWA
jgi:hypothetical protein